MTTRCLQRVIPWCGSVVVLAGLVVPLLARDRDGNKDQPRGGQSNPSIKINQQPRNGGGDQPRKMEIPRGQPNIQFGGNQPGGNPPVIRRNENRGNNGPQFGGGNSGNNNPPVIIRRDQDNKPRGNSGTGGGGRPIIIDNPPVIKRNDGNNQPGGNPSIPNFGGGNSNIGGNPPVIKRGDKGNKDNKPGNPIFGGGNQPILVNPPVIKNDNPGRDNRPGGKNNPGTNMPFPDGKNPINRGDIGKGNQPGGIPNFGGGITNQPPIIKRGDKDNRPGGGPSVIEFGNKNNMPREIGKGIDRNPDINKALKRFEHSVTKRQENERNLLRNQDQIQSFLNQNPQLQDRVKSNDGKIDLSRLHLEQGRKDRISSIIHKNGDLPFAIDKDQDLSKHFRHVERVKDLDDLQRHLNHFQNPEVIKAHPELARIDFRNVSGNFQHRISDRRFHDHLISSQVGRQLNLGQQFDLHRHGDITRQLNLNVSLINNGGWRNRYSGPIYAGFTSGAFSSWYCGPSYYPRYCWCPTWSPWVDWCWWNTCPIVYDPRPIFCRPIVIYDPCPGWVVYDYPVWQPLPVVACGTWVDYSPVLVDNVDLQLVAVRFVDNGHPEQQLGARYRVWLQNSSQAGIGGPFNVLLMASNTPDGLPDLPQAGITIPGMDPGELKVVDIRLPFSASKMNRVENHLTPFNFLHVLVDSHRQLNDVNLANNGAILPRADILPVDPAAFAPDVSAAAPGALVSIAGEGFGPEPGRLIVSVNGVETEPTIYGWYDLGIQFELPNVPVSGPTNAEILVVRGDGAAANPVIIRMAAENRLEEAALPPAPEPAP